ncbi:MAG: ComEC/Rec2 family competence protein [Muribaculaceae bacterium]|nr:ComEC/Rec2 family competence protein [Muribaculaceae bacterium]
MANPTALSRVPVLRVLVPFVVGIIAFRIWSGWLVPVLILLLAVGIYVWALFKSRSPQGRMLWRPFYIIPLALTALALGWFAAYLHCPPVLDSSQRNGRDVTGRVVKLAYTDFSMRLTVELLESDLPASRVLLSTRGCDYTMNEGDIVRWQADLQEVKSMGNPGDRDEATRLLDSEGIRYQQHLPLNDLTRAGHSPTFLTRLATTRRALQLMVFNSRLSSSTQHFVVALLLGNSSLIDKATRQEFSAAGVAHVLSLSGLHVGFIALIIWGLLFPLDYLRLKKLRLVITLAAIILFAMFTGLSPSVVRATIMIGFVFSSILFYRRSVSLNALAMAALVILVFSPSSLFTVGFQLSFVTVLAILLFARVPESLNSRFHWVNYVTSTIITSLVAMFATMALTAYYFHTISLMSVLANLLILPVLPIFMILGALMLLVTSAGMQCNALDWSLDTLYRYIHWSSSLVNAIPGSHVSGVYVSAFGVVASFVILAFIALWLYRGRYRFLLMAGCVLVVLLGHSLWIDARTPRQGMIIFNSYSSTPIMYYEDGKGYVWIPDEEEPDSAAFSRYHAGFLARQGIHDLAFVKENDTLRLQGAMINPPYALLMGKRLMTAGSGRWKHMTANRRLPLDEIIVTKRFHGTATQLQQLFDFDRLIISGANHNLIPLQHECDSAGIKVHALSEEGALWVR